MHAVTWIDQIALPGSKMANTALKIENNLVFN